ncbi:MAG TPA: TIGR04283 family arsenosugar biosynthesis glycosyltransferase [Usitatibacter sp.]|nr:TIGR04283 family arsenosugar biosynthesis glycosyltransferase [Usitatibacter sp.]
MSPLSIIVPALDEAHAIGATLAALAPLRARGAEVLVVDGGSRDATREIAAPLCDRVLAAPRGRASQMNAGARESRGAILLFLHADTRLPQGALEAIEGALADGRRAWGRFDVRIEGRSPLLALVAFAMNLRSRLTGIATGDQAMFVRREAFERAGGFPAIPLMEDLALCAALKRASRPACLRERVATSGRRWERHGVLATIALMWRLRLAYALGVDPQRLARLYEHGRRSA